MAIAIKLLGNDFESMVYDGLCVVVFTTFGPLSPGQSLESAVHERIDAQSPLWPHGRVERRGRWNVRLRRLERPGPQ